MGLRYDTVQGIVSFFYKEVQQLLSNPSHGIPHVQVYNLGTFHTKSKALYGKIIRTRNYLAKLERRPGQPSAQVQAQIERLRREVVDFERLKARVDREYYEQIEFKKKRYDSIKDHLGEPEPDLRGSAQHPGQN